MKLSDIHLRDPFILAESGTYYLYGTRRGPTTKTIPWRGLDVYVSTDLREWSGPSECFSRPPEFWADRDFFAPEVHRYRGVYYMFASFRSETRLRCSQILRSGSPMGPFVPFSDPITPEDWSCLDATFWLDENGTPWTAFCHEWTQIGDGTIEVLKLTDDLSAPAGEPVTILRAGDSGWSRSLVDPALHNYVTDGPFFRRGRGGKLYMLWSGFTGEAQCTYVQALAISDSGSILGPWRHADRFLYDRDGGHGMLFDGFDGRTYLVLHSGNADPGERPRLFAVRETDDGFEITDPVG